MHDMILKQMKALEERHGVRIIYAVESGSRAWGFASPDSDYDVRYIYVRRPEEYVTVSDPRDTIEGPLDDVLDFSGWDLRKALFLLRKTNPSLMEWACSPIVYTDSPAWQHFRREMPAYFSVKAELHHYLSMARTHWKLIAPAEKPRIKRYMYMLRALLCAQWLECFGTMPPVAFPELCDGILDEALRPVVEDLLARKRLADERGLTEHIPALDALYQRESVRLRACADSLPPSDRENYPALNRLFRELIAESWAE